MELNYLSRAIFFFLLLSVLSSFSSTSFISDGVFEPQSLVIGRNLLQTKKPCPENFEFKNYTVITSRCKGPNYPPKECCGALKDFACPFADILNDPSTDCATTMLIYINSSGNYSSGLFASLCKEGIEGLKCPATPPSGVDVNAATTVSSRFWLTISAAFLVFVKLI